MFSIFLYVFFCYIYFVLWWKIAAIANDFKIFILIYYADCRCCDCFYISFYLCSGTYAAAIIGIYCIKILVFIYSSIMNCGTWGLVVAYGKIQSRFLEKFWWNLFFVSESENSQILEWWADCSDFGKRSSRLFTIPESGVPFLNKIPLSCNQ